MDSFNIDESLLNLALQKAAKGVEQYTNIMRLYQNVNVAIDKEFQRKYTYFYKVRRNQDFLSLYYSYMQTCRDKSVSFEEVLNYLFEKTGRIEASFSSKLVATNNPNNPIWDQYILLNIGMQSPKQYSKNRLQETIGCYNEINDWYIQIMNTDAAQKIINRFNELYGDKSISDLKKIDFVLWQLR